MARMYPEKPRFFKKESHEDEMFEALRSLPDDYLVIHSWKQTIVENNILEESQGDFVVYNKKYGILCIEAKSSGYYENNVWKYSSGKEMEHDGPYNQASDEKYGLMDYFEKKNCKDILKRCKILHAVWFYYVNRDYLKRLNLPPEADESITLTSESFGDIQSEIERLFKKRVVIRHTDIEIKTNLSDSDDKTIIEKILAPKFDLCSYRDMVNGTEKISFLRLEQEQKAILNYIEEEHFAVIQGLGGTGKTILAEEYAKRKNNKGEKVLFLCYNKKLSKKIRDIDLADYPNITVYSIDQMVMDYGFSFRNYAGLYDKILDIYFDDIESFPFKHVVVDEGQDFGLVDSELNLGNDEKINDAKKRVEIIKLLKDCVLHEKINGTFYLFYDKNQMVQSDVLPDFIQDADCRLSLYKNCRNTANIAETSIRFLNNNVKVKLRESAIESKPTELYFAYDSTTTVTKLNELLDYIKNEVCDLKNVVILTCNSCENSIITSETHQNSNNDYYYNDGKGHHISFASCTQFKGLEAEAVIIVDIDENALCYKQQKLYVGASRAKRRLYLISSLDDQGCKRVAEKYGKKARGNLKNVIKGLLSCSLEK